MSRAVIQKLNELGYSTMRESFYDKVDEWKSWYQGNVKGFHRYKGYNGCEWVDKERVTLGMAKKVCEDWANLLMNEKVQITLDGQKEQEFIDHILSENNFTVKASEMQEMKSALGTVAYVPRIIGQKVNEADKIIPGTASDISINYVTIENIYPLTWMNGFISECAFSTVVSRNGKDYLYLQIHRKDSSGNYVIENRIYRYDNEILVDEQFANVKGYENTQPIVQTDSEKRTFVIDRLNIANNFDYQLPAGIAVYANAIGALRGVDKAFDCYVNEFDNGALLLAVKMPATRYDDGKPTFDNHDNRFYLLPEDTTQGDVVEPISPNLRTQQLTVGLKDQLNILASKCGFGETYYRFDGGNVATATQVISENSTMFRTIKKHEVILESVLIELCRLLLQLGNTAMSMGLNEDVEISVNFDDSIIVDTESQRAQDRLDVSMGAMTLLEYRMKWYGEDENTAQKALAKMNDMTDEQQNEVE